MQSKILLYTKTTFSCEKVYHFFGLTFQMFYQFFKSWKSQIIWLWFWVTQMIKIYTLRRILFRLTSWFSLPESTCSTNRVRPISSRPANICWSSRRLQDMSWRRLQHVFSITILRLPRRLEDMPWRCLEDISWRRLQDVSEANKIFAGDICI